MPPFVLENNFSKDKENFQPLEIDFDRKFPNRLVKNHFFLGKTNFFENIGSILDERSSEKSNVSSNLGNYRGKNKLWRLITRTA